MAAGLGPSMGPSPQDLAARKAGIDAVKMSLQDAARQWNAEAGAVLNSAHAHTAHGGASYANRMQMMELAHVGRAVFDEMAAGGNVFRALAMEGGRLQVALSTGEGGVTGTLGRLGTGMASLLTPVRLVTAGVLGIGVAAALAFSSFESGQDTLTRSLDGIGRRSAATVAQLNAVGTAGARAAGLSTSEGLNLAAGFTSAGIAPSTTEIAIGASKAYGRITGQGTDAGGTALAAALRDPVRGVAD